jgi:hypothetical protein
MDDNRIGLPSRYVCRPGPHALLQALGLLLLVAMAAAQNGYPPPMGGHIGQQVYTGDGFDPQSSVEDEKRLRLLNADRQKSMVADTNRLLKLAQELDAEVGSANSDALNPAQLRKVAEIEKLAHNIREKMSTSVRGIPSFGPSIVFPTR